MLATILIAFREGLEAALIIGIVFGYLKRTGQQRYYRSVWAGALSAVLASIAVAVAIQAVGAELEGQAEQIFEGVTMILAVAVLTWMIFWMRTQARSIKSTLEHELEQAVGKNQHRGLMMVAFFAVFREGVETALFLSAASFAASGENTLLGTLIGLAVAAAIGYA
ncbi:MAG: FTR1 family protein, partial [Anaerolineae bacterium]|nr:FTR1 family protein [Anaerolineae bacterium]